MPQDPFDKARKEMERVQREFHERMQRARQDFRRAMDAGHGRISEALAEYQERIEAVRRATNGPRKKPPGGKFGGSTSRRGPGPGGPQPSPVRPPSPSFLSGGAEAPLDE